MLALRRFGGEGEGATLRSWAMVLVRANGMSSSCLSNGFFSPGLVVACANEARAVEGSFGNPRISGVEGGERRRRGGGEGSTFS